MKKLSTKYLQVFILAFSILISLFVFIIRDSLYGLSGYGYLGLFALSILGNATIILPVPVVLTAFLGGGIFNPFWVAVVISLGATIGEFTGYLAGVSGKEIVKKGKNVERIERWMKKYGLWTLFVLAAIPNPLFDIAGIIAGATKVPAHKYFLVVCLGKFIKFAAIAFLGYGLFQI